MSIYPLTATVIKDLNPKLPRNLNKKMFVPATWLSSLIVRLVGYPVREVAGSIPSWVNSHGVSVVDVQLRIPLDLCSPPVNSAECSRNRL